MKRYRLFAVASALLLLCSLTGCSFSGADADSAELSSYNEPNLPRCDIEAYKAKIEDLRQNWLKSNQEEAIGQTVQELLDAVDEAYALYAHAEIDYYSDWTKDALSDYRSRTYEDMCVVSDMTGWAIVNGERKSAYPALFAPYLPDGNLDYYRLHNLQRIMSYSRQSAADSALLLDDYYDVAYDDSVDPDETDLACAGLYLDILKETSPSDYDYEAFERDYTPEDVSALYSELLETVYPLFVRLAAYFAETDPALPEQTDALQFLREHAEKLSPEIGESADKLFLREWIKTSCRFYEWPMSKRDVSKLVFGDIGGQKNHAKQAADMEVAINSGFLEQSTMKKNGAYMWEPNEEIKAEESNPA